MRRKGRCCRRQPAAGGVSGKAGYFFTLQEIWEDCRSFCQLFRWLEADCYTGMDDSDGYFYTLATMIVRRIL